MLPCSLNRIVELLHSFKPEVLLSTEYLSKLLSTTGMESWIYTRLVLGQRRPSLTLRLRECARWLPSTLQPSRTHDSTSLVRHKVLCSTPLQTPISLVPTTIQQRVILRISPARCCGALATGVCALTTGEPTTIREPGTNAGITMAGEGI